MGHQCLINVQLLIHMRVPVTSLRHNLTYHNMVTLVNTYDILSVFQLLYVITLYAGPHVLLFHRLIQRLIVTHHVQLDVAAQN
jgi:hypothetical protein